MRIFAGCVFLVSGLEKLLRPYENFAYVIEGYQLFDRSFAEIVAMTFPWVEFLTGLFLLLGLWLKASLRLALVMTTTFVLIVAQALLRKLPLDECGCFGELISLPLSSILLFDSCLLIALAASIVFVKRTSFLSLDRYFEKQK